MSLERARKAAEIFGLDPASVKPVAMRENLTFSATKDGLKYALRLHRPGYSSPAEIHSELQWMLTLSEGRLSVPAPLASEAENLVEVIDDQVVSILAWMPGQTMQDTLDQPNANRLGVFHTLGETLAQLHNVSDNWAIPHGFTRRNWDYDGLLGEDPVWGRFWENPHLSSSDRETLTSLRSATSEQLKTVARDLDYGLIHADAVAENVLYSHGNPTLIDFDDSGFGFRLFDLATPLNREKGADDYAEIEASMFEGYRKHRPLDTTHFKLIALLRALTYIGWIVPRIDEPGGRQRLERFIAKVKSFTG